jgi:DNA-binding MarR family transcriptional regulator
MMVSSGGRAAECVNYLVVKQMNEIRPTEAGRASRPAPTAASSWDQTTSLLALRQVMNLGARVRQAVARRTGLTESEVLAMEHLAAGPAGPAELARRLHVSTAAATGIVDRLAGRGHAERQPHERDRRRTEVHLTASGREEVMRLLSPMFAALQRLDEGLTERDRAVVTAYLAGAVEACRKVTDP